MRCGSALLQERDRGDFAVVALDDDTAREASATERLTCGVCGKAYVREGATPVVMNC